MATLETYRKYIQELLTEHSKLVWDDRIKAETIFDTERDRYQLVYVGWQGSKRVYGVVLHLDIINGKIWIQRNMTEVDIAQELVNMGVPKEDIVLGLHAPYKRPYTGYGVA